jgi:hypothetical protein
MTLSTPSMITVSTRYGAITFETRLEWNEAITELRKVAFEGNEFATSLLEREEKNLYMSDSQVSWVYKIAQDAISNREFSEKVVDNTDASNILGTLIEASVNGLKKPLLRLKMENGAEVRIKYMKSGKIAGGCWVTVNDELRGKIDDQGEFTIYNCKYKEADWIANLIKFIEQVNSNPKDALISYGRMTSHCGCCGLPLTNKESIRIGIGPICLSKYGLLALA